MSKHSEEIHAKVCEEIHTLYVQKKQGLRG